MVPKGNSECWTRINIQKYTQIKLCISTTGCRDAPTQWLSKCCFMGFNTTLEFPHSPSSLSIRVIVLCLLNISIPCKISLELKKRDSLLKKANKQNKRAKQHWSLIPSPHLKKLRLRFRKISRFLFMSHWPEWVT